MISMKKILSLIVLITVLSSIVFYASTTISAECGDGLSCPSGQICKNGSCIKKKKNSHKSKYKKENTLLQYCEQRCYDIRTKCFNDGKQTETCESEYDSCKTGCN